MDQFRSVFLDGTPNWVNMANPKMFGSKKHVERSRLTVKKKFQVLLDTETLFVDVTRLVLGMSIFFGGSRAMAGSFLHDDTIAARQENAFEVLIRGGEVRPIDMGSELHSNYLAH
jgi:hypothetical protein